LLALFLSEATCIALTAFQLLQASSSISWKRTLTGKRLRVDRGGLSVGRMAGQDLNAIAFPKLSEQMASFKENVN